jgi:hypothetical protein
MIVKYTPIFGNMPEFPRDEILPKEETRLRVLVLILLELIIDKLGSNAHNASSGYSS